MTRIGLALALVAVIGLMGWGAARVGAGNHASAAEAPPAAEAADDGTHDEAVYRHRTSQSTHWRHVMVGRR